MPVLKVYGVLPEMAKVLPEMTEMLIKTICAIPELGLTEDQISCFYPVDLMPRGLGEEIVVFVDGLLDKPERTEKVRAELATSVVRVVMSFFQSAKLIECMVKPFKENHGFSSCKRVFH